MPDYGWPKAEDRTLIGKRITRVDAPLKVSGQAKYTYDTHRPGMLYGKIVRSPYAKIQNRQHRHICGGENARRKGRSHHSKSREHDSLGWR